MHWANIGRLPSNDIGETFTMQFVILAMLFDAFIYAVFTWYVEAVWPGEFGIPLRWYFPFKVSTTS